MRACATRVENCIKEAREIYEAVRSLAQTQYKALLDTHGIESISSSEGTDDKTDCSLCDSFSSHDAVDIHVPGDSSLVTVMCESDCNWFEFVERVEDTSGLDIPWWDISSALEKFFLQTPLGFSKEQLELIVQSHHTFTAARSACYEQKRMARSEIVSESESDNPEQYIGVKSALSKAGKKVVQKK